MPARYTDVHDMCQTADRQLAPMAKHVHAPSTMQSQPTHWPFIVRAKLLTWPQCWPHPYLGTSKDVQAGRQAGATHVMLKFVAIFTMQMLLPSCGICWSNA